MKNIRFGRRLLLKGGLASLAAGTAFAGSAISAEPQASAPRKTGIAFGTLGSQGSNHSYVLQKYLAFRQLEGASVRLFQAFDEAFEALAAGDLDFVLQVSVHPSHADMVARFFNRVHIVDAFIAPSKPLAVVTRRSVQKPVSIALQPATRHYTDLSAWSQQIDEVSIATVAEGLLSGRYDSGLTARELAERYPEQFRIDRDIGAATDTWVLFGHRSIPVGQICAWAQAPVTKLFADGARDES
ncbi:MAG: hypothetical protein JSS29_07750 [Proteobacteria bacterium]|nr:hypothetical protein [Pseudomonadota bacterium]